MMSDMKPHELKDRQAKIYLVIRIGLQKCDWRIKTVWKYPRFERKPGQVLSSITRSLGSVDGTVGVCCAGAIVASRRSRPNLNQIAPIREWVPYGSPIKRTTQVAQTELGTPKSNCKQLSAGFCHRQPGRCQGLRPTPDKTCQLNRSMQHHLID